jgi:hypothetical protein
MSASQSTIRHRFDRFGLILAGLCALHCAATAMIVATLGIGVQFFASPVIHEIGLLLATVFAAIAIGGGAMVHRKTAPTLLAVAGLGLMGAALTVPHGLTEIVLTVVGVMLVSAGHLLNLRAAA